MAQGQARVYVAPQILYSVLHRSPPSTMPEVTRVLQGVAQNTKPEMQERGRRDVGRSQACAGRVADPGVSPPHHHLVSEHCASDLG